MSLICANIFTNILYIALAIAVLLLMVLIHELGHYVVGRILKFKITEFSIGFGKAIFQRKNKRGELISLRIFPLGGYCAFEGEGDDDEPENDKNTDKSNEIKDAKTDTAKQIISEMEDIGDNKKKVEEIVEKNKYNPDAFNNQKPWKRILVYLAGVTFNFLSAIIFSLILLLSYGYDIQRVENLDTSYAYLYNVTGVAEEGLQVGDVVWAVNGTDVNFATSGTLPTLLKAQPVGENITLRVNRNGETINVIIKLEEQTYTTESGKEATKLLSGFTTTAYRHNFLEAIGRCWGLSFGFAWVVLKSFAGIFTGAVGISQLGGPIATIGAISTITQSGFANFLILLPLLSANLAIFNVLPIPALDGSHVVFTLIEWIRRKPINRKVENYIHFFGLITLLLLVVVIDIIHFFI